MSNPPIPEQHKELPLKLAEFFHNLGQWMLIDDIWDIGKFSFEGHDSPFHHWQLGYVMKEIALYAGQAFTIAQAWNDAGQEMVSTTKNILIEQIEAQSDIFDGMLDSFPKFT